ncbi:MAG: ABC transporter ATP-binding protein [Halioglobus sp.]|nr:ABC transporter ATP-binding protein [Halioglobus sp.]
MPSIEVQQLEKSFSGTVQALFSGLSFSVDDHECLCLLGPSGCGKTTLLRLLMGLEKPNSGTVQMNPALSGKMSYVFQEPRLIPWRTCLENVLLPLELTSQNNPAARSRAIELLEKIGLNDRLEHFPDQLSGGMQMRVALARALITQPKIVLLDEPFAALDERTRFRMQDLLLELKARLDLQYIFVTHSIAEAVYISDRILLLDNTGMAKDLRSLTFSDRDQSLKLTPEFNAMVKEYSGLFSEMEDAIKMSDAAQSQ